MLIALSWLAQLLLLLLLLLLLCSAHLATLSCGLKRSSRCWRGWLTSSQY
jgi:hypothetical protein